MSRGGGRGGKGNQESRIAALRQEAKQLSGGKMMSWESDRMPAGMREAFWRRVVASETCGTTTDFEKLTRAGVELPAPDTLDDDGVSAKLWEVIDALAKMRVFISDTDHLSDRELYAKLWHEVLREETDALDEPGMVTCVPLLQTGGEEDTHLYLKYYADEKWRRDWHESFPDAVIPEHEDPSYDRDRWLPQFDFRTGRVRPTRGHRRRGLTRRLAARHPPRT